MAAGHLKNPTIERGKVFLSEVLGNEVEDADEETFTLFAQGIPSSNLGFVDAHASSIDIAVGKRDFVISQSPGLLSSNIGTGTTGAVLWKVTPLLAAWLADQSNFLWQQSLLTKNSDVVELGCGISGLVGLSLSHLVSRYLLTDQPYVMKLLKQNVSANLSNALTQPSKRHNSSRVSPEPVLRVLTLDWEVDSAANVKISLDADNGVDLLVACDCVYNDFLIKPFVRTCADICSLRSEAVSPTILLVAQQLRSAEVFECWLRATMEFFHVWKVPDNLLSKDLRLGRGFVIYVATLNPYRQCPAESQMGIQPLMV